MVQMCWEDSLSGVGGALASDNSSLNFKLGIIRQTQKYTYAPPATKIAPFYFDNTHDQSRERS